MNTRLHSICASLTRLSNHRQSLFLCIAVLLSGCVGVRDDVHSAATPKPDQDGFIPLFNGKDLSGWIPSNVAPETFTVKDGLIVSTGLPTGVMRTARMYENFIIELEWRHLKPGGNAGLFIWGDPITSAGVPFARGIEVQILDNAYGEGSTAKNVAFTTHGDIFPIHGATMTPTGRVAKSGRRSFPTEDRSKSAPEWNHYRVIATNGVVRLSVNGQEVTVGTDCSPRKGYICLESEGSECHFRNIRLKELPSTQVPPEHTAKADVGFKTLYTGLDLKGWRTNPSHAAHWQARDWTLNSNGKGRDGSQTLLSEAAFASFEMIVDYRLTGNKVTQPTEIALILRDDIVITLPADGDAAAAKTRGDKPPGQWNRVLVTAEGSNLTVRINDKVYLDNVKRPLKRGSIGLRHTGDAAQFASVYVRELR